MTGRKMPPVMTYAVEKIEIGIDDKIPDHAILHFAFDGQAIGFRVPLREVKNLSLRLFEAHRILSQTKPPH